jgi:hypothetical protein
MPRTAEIVRAQRFDERENSKRRVSIRLATIWRSTMFALVRISQVGYKMLLVPGIAGYALPLAQSDLSAARADCKSRFAIVNCEFTIVNHIGRIVAF